MLALFLLLGCAAELCEDHGCDDGTADGARAGREDAKACLADDPSNVPDTETQGCDGGYRTAYVDCYEAAYIDGYVGMMDTLGTCQ